MLAETIRDKVADAIERRIETDFGEYKIMPTSADRLRQVENHRCLRIVERTSVDEKWTAPFATIEVRCDRIGLVKYESVVHAYMDLDEVADDLARLSIEENILMRYRSMEPEVITTMRHGISRVVVQILGGGESEEKGEIFVHRKLNISFNIARMTMGLNDILAGGPKEAFDDVATAASERMRALREIHGIVSKKSGRLAIP
jgi:hypothetical protein